jgi:CRISPR-associated protein Csx16
VDLIKNGDQVLGTLPVSIAAEICDKGARYFHLILDLPPELRGQELSAQDMKKAEAKLKEYEVRKV